MKVVIYGAGKIADYMSYAISNDSENDVVAFCVEAAFKPKGVQNYHDLPFVDFENIEKTFPPDEYRLFIAIGNNWVRERIFNIAKHKGYSLLSYLSSQTIVWDDLQYGENVFIMEGSGMQPFVSIGDNTFVMGARIGHHSQIGNNVLLGSCTLAGSVSIGDNSFLGVNTAVKEDVIIGRNNIIGLGCIITKNTGDDEVYSEKSTSKRKISSKLIRDKFL